MNRIRLSLKAFGVRKFKVICNKDDFALINFFGCAVWVLKTKDMVIYYDKCKKNLK